MIVRVHFGLGALPVSRLGLHGKCTETLLKHRADAKGLGESPIDYYLNEKGCPDTFHLVDRVIERLHAHDAILVQYGTDPLGRDQFGFVHRSFQEFFAACWMAHKLEEEDFNALLDEHRERWSETLYLAVAQLPDRRRRKTQLNLLKSGRAEFALQCLRAAPPEQPWLKLLVQFLSRYTWRGRDLGALTAAECADAYAARSETSEVLAAMFKPENREAPSLAAAVKLAEELARHGEQQATAILDGFFSEAADYPEYMVLVPAGPFPFGKQAAVVDVPAFWIDRYPVTNQEFERMVPSHRGLRDRISTAGREPVIFVSWHEAHLFCRWRGRGCRLPTEIEWEKAASWDEKNQQKRVHPWGDDFDPSRCNTSEGGPGKPTRVGAYPSGQSAYGCHDMAGNVWEWTASSWNEGDVGRVLRGDAWYYPRGLAACACCGLNHPPNTMDFFGFRCARTSL